MKKALLTINSFILSVLCFAQAPQGFNYQGVAQNAAGDPVASKTIKVRLSILDITASGTVVYAETHTPITNTNGLFSTTVGAGTVVSGVFANIDWANGNKFLKSEIDISGGNNFATVATTQMMSVPYALYAQTAGKSTIKPVSDADFVLFYDRYETPKPGGPMSQVSGWFSGFFELKASWKNDIFNVVSKLYVDNQLVSTKAGLDVTTNSNLGIYFSNNQYTSSSTFKLVAYFQLESGEIYKVQKDLVLPTNKYFLDMDGDSYGAPTSEFYSSNISNYLISGQIDPNAKIVQIGGDCCDDPNNGTCGYAVDRPDLMARPENIHPGATEIGNGIDDNCDGQIDEGIPLQTWYRDQDGDGYGSTASIQSVMDMSTQGYSLRNGDCFDTNADYMGVAHDSWTLLYQSYVLGLGISPSTVHPGALEVINGVDDNCNGQVDEGFARVNWYLDKDDDDYGIGLPAFSTAVTNQLFSYTADPSGHTYSLNNTDCDDTNPQIHPNATEINGNQVDENCDGVIGSASICGNGLIDGTEGCDDHNLTNGDGCSNVCKVEPGFACTGTPSVCVPAP